MFTQFPEITDNPYSPIPDPCSPLRPTPPPHYRLEKLPPTPWYRKTKSDCKVVFIPVESGDESSAIAISYSRGPQPEKLYILPTSDDSRLTLRLSIATWTLDEFIENLWNATKGEPFWLDQFNLPWLSKATIRELYSNIPMIYRTHRVRILANTAPCKLIESWKNLDSPNVEVIEAQLSLFEKHTSDCRFCRRLYLWSSRLWLRQEAYYAADLQLVFNDSPSINIARVNGKLRGVDINLLPDLSTMMNDKVGTPLRDQPHFSNGNDSDEVKELQWRFLRGESLKFSHVVTFEESLQHLARSCLKVSQPIDMVSAIWPGLEGYHIPDNAQDQKPLELLHNACRQYAQIRNRQVPVHYISRFASAGKSSALPRIYTPSLEPYIIASPSAVNTLLWYGQWIPGCAGLQLDSLSRVLGEVQQERVQLKAMQDFRTIHSTPSHVAQMLVRQFDKKYRWQLIKLVHLQAGGQKAHQDWRHLISSVSNVLCESSFGAPSFPENDKFFNNDTIVILCLLVLGIPIHLYREHRTHIRFFLSADKWLPALCIVDDDPDLRIMFAEGLDLAYIVVESASKGLLDDREWEVVGMIPGVIPPLGGITPSEWCS